MQALEEVDIMENYELKREDIDRLWSQIVSQIGVKRFSHTEWQTIYEDFWKCMLPETKAFIQIPSVNIAEINCDICEYDIFLFIKLEKLLEPLNLQSLELHRKKNQGKTNSKPKNQQLVKKKEKVRLKPSSCLLQRMNVANTEQENISNMQSYKVNICIYLQFFTLVEFRYNFLQLNNSTGRFTPLTVKKPKCEKKFPNNVPMKSEVKDLTLIDNWLDNCNEMTPSENDFEINGDSEYIDCLVNKYPLDTEITFGNCNK